MKTLTPNLQAKLHLAMLLFFAQARRACEHGWVSATSTDDTKLGLNLGSFPAGIKGPLVKMRARI